MRYIMSAPNSKGRRLTTPLKVLHHWWLTAQPWFSQNWFTSIKWWIAVYSLRLGEETNESIVRGKEQWVNGNSQSSASRMAMANDSTRKAAPYL